MASEPPEGYGDDFLEQILAIPSSYNNIEHHQQTVFPLGLSLDNGAHFTPTHQQQQQHQQQQRVSSSKMFVKVSGGGCHILRFLEGERRREYEYEWFVSFGSSSV
ncbi:hypothetical protein Tco_0785449 [Tanacetum coccineum]